MQNIEFSPQILPDVAAESLSLRQGSALDQVGMQQIETPLLIEDQHGQVYRTAGLAEAFVNIREGKEFSTRGIHMSRLFKISQEAFSSEKLTWKLLQKILTEFLQSHLEISDHARVGAAFSAFLQRPALKSANRGYRSYPVRMSAEQNSGQMARCFLEVLITYSSTCPASAALSRKLIQTQFLQDFSSENISKAKVHEWLGSSSGIVATPHAQRSYARVRVELKDTADFNYTDLIDLLEETLQTAVQSVVKREDEQEFALRNGQNLMFCEDAARRIQHVLEGTNEVRDFFAEVRHAESLHPHDAVAKVTKRQSRTFL